MDFELFGSLNPGIVRVSTENSKAEVILARCAILKPATALFRLKRLSACGHRALYSDLQKSVPAKLARLLLLITTGCCFDSRTRIDNVFQKPLFCDGLLENAMEACNDQLFDSPSFLCL